jgi:hypothetical protein
MGFLKERAALISSPAGPMFSAYRQTIRWCRLTHTEPIREDPIYEKEGILAIPAILLPPSQLAIPDGDYKNAAAYSALFNASRAIA